MKLRTQFIVNMLIFGVVLLVIAASVIVTEQQIVQLSYQEGIASEIENGAEELNYLSNVYFIYNQSEQLDLWQVKYASMLDNLSLLNSTNARQQSVVNNVLGDMQRLGEVFASSIQVLNRLPPEQSARNNPLFQAVWSRVIVQNQALNFDTSQLSYIISSQVNQLRTTNLLLILTLIGLFGAFFVTTYFVNYRHTLRSISDLQRGVKIIGSGNLDYAIEGKKQDEIGELTYAFNQMAHNLKDTTTSKTELEKEIWERKKAQQRLMEAQVKLQEYATDLERLVEERTEKIRESEQSYRELYESFGEAFIAIDWELNVIHWNKAAERVTTITAKDALGKKIYEILPEMMAVNVEPYYETLREKKSARFMMNVVSRQTGKPSIFEISTYPSTLGIIIIVEDKTEEEQTKRLSTIGQVAGMVGHDLRNPLQAIIGEVYLAKDELKTLQDSEQKTNLQENLQAIAEQIRYMDKIVSDLQAFVKPVQVNKQIVNLKQLITAVLTQINIPKDIQIKLHIEDTLNVDADPLQLKRVLINLVTNAVQAMPEGGELTVKVEAKGKRQVQITIKDTGVGIPDEVKSKIFTPLFTTKAKGQGFGLAVCKRVIEAQGGAISFESQQNKGTTFTINLPAST